MTLQGSQRRGMRRRMLQSGSGASQTPDASAAATRPDRTTPYSKEARPENHPALGTWLPTRPLMLWGTILAFAAPIVAVVTLAATLDWILPRTAGGAAGRGDAWTTTAGQVRECLSMAPRAGMAAWLGQLALVVAACVAISVRQMRRHRLDDYQGRYRAWGWIAGLAVVATLERQLPLAPLASSVVADATGILLGPGGMAWWLCLSIPCCLAVGLWAVLPMHERMCTASVLAASGLAWLGAATCGWLEAGGPSDRLTLTGGGLTLVGDGLLLVAMLVAARSVLLEVRGEARIRPGKGSQTSGKSTATRADGGSQPRLVRGDESDDASETEDGADQSTQWSDGSDGGEDESDDAWDDSGRKLSKSEKKRLRKMARMNRAA
jgi:hypothetical protein